MRIAPSASGFRDTVDRLPGNLRNAGVRPNLEHSGERITVLAARYGISRETVLQHLKKLDEMTLVEAAAATGSNSRSILPELGLGGIPRRKRGQRLRAA